MVCLEYQCESYSSYFIDGLVYGFSSCFSDCSEAALRRVDSVDKPFFALGSSLGKTSVRLWAASFFVCPTYALAKPILESLL